MDQHYVKIRSSVRISKPKMQYIDRSVFDMEQIQMYVMGEFSLGRQIEKINDHLGSKT